MKRKRNQICTAMMLCPKTFAVVFLLFIIPLQAVLADTPADPAGTSQDGLTVSGTVIDEEKGEPVPGVSIRIEGTSTGTITDLQGNYTLEVPGEDAILVFSFVGYTTQRIRAGDAQVSRVILAMDVTSLEGVVVVGYGTQKKVTVTGSVSGVKSEQLIQSPVANISNSLAGRATGVLAVQRSGAPGEDQSQIRIRGIGTFAGSQNPLILVDGIESDSYNNIDPYEIDNISILKDASATAVYGVRGANGVILITTKRGLVSKPQISFTSNLSWVTWVDAGIRDRMNAYDYASGWNEALQYDAYISGKYNPLFTDEELQKYKDQSDPIFYPDTDWMDLILKDYSFQHQYNLNLRGGTEDVKYFVSIGMFNQAGLFNNTNLVEDFFDMQSKYSRYNFRSNLDFQITKRLKASINLVAKIDDKEGMDENNVAGFMRSISLANPLGDPPPVDGMFIDTKNSVSKDVNPLQALYTRGYRNSAKNYLDGSVRLDYDLDFLTQGLSIHATLNYKNDVSVTKRYHTPIEVFTARKDIYDETVFISNNADGPISLSQSYGKRRYTYAEAALDYFRSFGKHNFTGLLLYNQSKNYSPSLQYLIPNGYQGLVGRIAYDYASKYLVEYNAGYNGTENFAPGRRFGYFPAYSLGWVVSNEQFFPQNNIVTFLKFRGSYGEVGNDKIGGDRFLYLPSAYTYANEGSKDPYGAYYWGEVGLSTEKYQGVYEGKIGNPLLTWERAKKTNIGFDMRMFSGGLRISADAFKEYRDNILSLPNNVPVLAGMGNNIPAVNLGEMENKGFEFEVIWHGTAGSFNYWIQGTYTFARNKIIFQDEVPNPWSYLNTTGQRYGQFFGYVDDGLFNSWEEVSDAYRPNSSFQNNLLQPGDINWKDINGDGVVDQYDQAPVGYSGFPEVAYGISFGGDFHGFDFSLLFQGASHVSFYGGDKYIFGWNNYQATNQYLENSWSYERYEAGLPIYFPHHFVPGTANAVNMLQGSFYTKDASYIRLRNAEIGYNLENAKLESLTGIESLRVFVNASNLWTWAYKMDDMYPGVDPENVSIIGSSNQEPYPRTRVFNFGLNIIF